MSTQARIYKSTDKAGVIAMVKATTQAKAYALQAQTCTSGQ